MVRGVLPGQGCFPAINSDSYGLGAAPSGLHTPRAGNTECTVDTEYQTEYAHIYTQSARHISRLE
jgi:hypothetical protein